LPIYQRRKTEMYLGKGVKIAQEDRLSLILRTCPYIGNYLRSLTVKMKELDTRVAPNQHAVIVGSSGSTKTTLGKHIAIEQKIEAGEGGLLIDAKEDDESLSHYTIRKLAAVGWDPARCVVLDFYSKFGYFLLDFLEIDPDNEHSPYEVTEEAVTATSLLSNLR